MTDLKLYKRMENWTAENIPAAFLDKHNTKAGTWAKLTILSGSLTFFELDEDGKVLSQQVFTAESDTPFVQPQVWHKIAPASDDLEFYLEFYCQPEDYLAKKYDIKPHSEIAEAVALGHLKPGKALDLGAGYGRNSLYLASLGHEVTAVDVNEAGLVSQREIAEAENFALRAGFYDINLANIPEEGLYDLILSTVVFMFLDTDMVPHIIADMQNRTAIGGHNLIVCAMDTAENPCIMPFNHTFSEGELIAYYEDWEIVKYNEDLGHLHRVDQFGNPIGMQFATLLAKKVK